MATFEVAVGTDWIERIAFGEVGERWRLDDYVIRADVKNVDDDQVLIALSLDNGRLVIIDPVSRRLEINVGWATIEPFRPGPFRFDFLFANRSTGVRSRSEAQTLLITDGITGTI